MTMLLVLFTCLTVLGIPCPAQGCPRPPPPPSRKTFPLDLYWSYSRKCQAPGKMIYPQPSRPLIWAPWAIDRRYPDYLLCMINMLSNNRSPSSEFELHVTDGAPVKLSCQPLETFERGIHIEHQHVPGLGEHRSGIYYWTKDQRKFCEKWERNSEKNKCDDGVDRSAPDSEVWIQSFTAADEGVYACAYMENCINEDNRHVHLHYCPLRVGPAVRIHVVPKISVVPSTKTSVPDIPRDTTSASPTSQAETPVSSASVITPLVKLRPVQWFSTVSTNGAQRKEHATSAIQTTAISSSLTNTTAQSTTFQSFPSVETSAMSWPVALPDSETLYDYSEVEIVAPTVAKRAPRVGNKTVSSTVSSSVAVPAVSQSDIVDYHAEEDFSDIVGEIFELVATTTTATSSSPVDTKPSSIAGTAFQAYRSLPTSISSTFTPSSVSKVTEATTSTSDKAPSEFTRPTNSSPLEMDALSAAHMTDVADAEGTWVTEAEGFKNGYPPTPMSSTTVVGEDQETVSTAGVNDTEYDADYDHAPGDQRRASSFPPECPPCTGNCPCPLFKRKRKHL
ncbi:mucin-17-like isoform X2 [Paramacrobiotus metropolitanus]|uniref:mucin-17-like isoform X2 n=1 Tax=Paramacrobiotus metropolitanus TaxID=2943436 RepID=UPI00244610C6|nr:mucin-17-like isoform X2 [Paramacrobiotus metropolitanus]